MTIEENRTDNGTLSRQEEYLVKVVQNADNLVGQDGGYTE